MRAISFVVTATAALVPCAPAVAKEPIRATFCGDSGCRTVTDQATLEWIPAGESSTPLGAAAPYYRVDIVAGDEDNTHTFSFYYVPSANATAWAENGQVRSHPIYGEPTTSLMRRVTAGLDPFPAPRLSAVNVGDRLVTGADAQTYLRLFTLPAAPEATTQSSDWLRIDLRSRTRSPWTDVPTEFSYSREDEAIVRGWEVVELDGATAANLESARALDASAGESPWGHVAVAAFAVAVLGFPAALLVSWQKRRGRAAGRPPSLRSSCVRLVTRRR